MIESISSISGAAPMLELAPKAQGVSGDFYQFLGNSLGVINTNLNASDQALRAVAAGQDIPLHDVMITMERARLNLQFAVEVRNRVVEAYQQLTQMQL